MAVRALSCPHGIIIVLVADPLLLRLSRSWVGFIKADGHLLRHIRPLLLFGVPADIHTARLADILTSDFARFRPLDFMSRQVHDTF